jgi:phage replication O-like protein O
LASPQLEHGYARIANEILESLALSDLTGYEYRIIFLLLRESYGRGKKEAELSYGEIAKRTRLDRSNVFRTLKNLHRRTVVITAKSRTVVANDTSHKTAFIFQKDYHRWTVVKKRTVVQKDTSTVVIGDNTPIGVKKEKKEGTAKAVPLPIAPQAQEPKHPVHRLIALFIELLEVKSGKGAAFPAHQAGAFFKKMLKTNEEFHLATTVKNYFDSSDPFITNSGFSWGAYQVKFNALKGGPVNVRTNQAGAVGKDHRHAGQFVADPEAAKRYNAKVER